MSAEPRFAPGERVVIRDLAKPGHVRTPRYARDRTGVVERFCGAFHNPEESAYGRPAPRVPLYRVRLRQAELWPDYAGPPTDTLELEIFEHWLAPAGQGDRPMSAHDHAHDAAHDHTHAHPPAREDDDVALSRDEAKFLALKAILIEKGLVTADEIRARMELDESHTWHQGAHMVARAWVDPAYRERMLADGKAAAIELGIPVTEAAIVTVENGPARHNLIVCTLCSCYPRSLLGEPPSWYVSKAYRSRAVREPRKVLKEFGLAIADDVEVRVHDSNADMRYIVLPMRPAGTEGMSEEELQALVTRDCLVGAALPRPPAA